MTVPIQAIQRGENKTTVLVLDAQNRVQPRDVQVGVESSNNVEILGGLTEGERVIVGNLGSYQAGTDRAAQRSRPMLPATETE